MSGDTGLETPCAGTGADVAGPGIGALKAVEPASAATAVTSGAGQSGAIEAASPGVSAGNGGDNPQANLVQPRSSNGSGAGERNHQELAEQEDLDDRASAFGATSAAPIKGFSGPASQCIEKAGWIAYVLNHARMNAAHLILAMSLDKKAASGLKSRGLDVEELRRGMMETVLSAKWDYTDEEAERTPVIRTSADLSNILEAAKRRAGERDNQPAALTDLFDVLILLNAEGKLVPPKSEPRENAAVSEGFARVSENFTQVLGRLEELQMLVDQGFRANTSHFDTAMAAATSELLTKLASPPADDAETPPPPTAGTAQQGTGWKNPFRLALLGLL